MRAIESTDAPAPIGPYSQAIEAGPFVFLGGQIPLDPRTGQMVTGDIAREADQVLDNLAAVLAEAGLSLAHLAKVNIYLTNLGDFAAVNEAYAKRFPGPKPARATVEVRALPAGARVEMDGIAYRP